MATTDPAALAPSDEEPLSGRSAGADAFTATAAPAQLEDAACLIGIADSWTPALPLEGDERWRLHADRGRRRHRIGTAGRLVTFHLVILGVVIGGVVVLIAKQLSSSYEQLASKGLVSELHQFAAEVPAPARPAGGARGEACAFLRASTAYFGHHALPTGTVLAVAAPACPPPAGSVVASGSSNGLVEEVLRAPAAKQALETPPAASSARPAVAGSSSVELLTSPVRAGARVIGTFVAADDLAPFLANRSRVVAVAIAEAAVALVAGVLGTWFLLRRLLRTVGRITTAAEEIEQGEIDRRLGDQGTDDEVGRLASTFDRMLDRIESAMTSQRRLLSDVSHQLRTPLTVARGHLEVLQRTGADDPAAVDETLSLVLDELDHMRSLVERLLLLGRAMEPDFLAVGPIDLRSLLGDLHAASRVLAERRFVLPPLPDVVVLADESKLRGALLNLVDNAVKATGPGDVIGISARLEPASGDLLLSVDDSGSGIEDSERAAAMARFSRPGARDAGGSGLGLAIVKAVAEAHRGGIDISDSPLGGCRVTVRLPASAIRNPGDGAG